MRRRTFIKNASAAAAFGPMVKGLANPAAASLPNIVLIMADDLGYGDLNGSVLSVVVRKEWNLLAAGAVVGRF